MDNVDVDVSDEVVGDEYDELPPTEEERATADAADEGEYAATSAADSDVAERLRGLIVYLATNLVDDPNSVEVEARQRGGSVFVSLRVPEEELGKVIGRGGRIARAMRTALMISGSRSNVRASLDIED